MLIFLLVYFIRRREDGQIALLFLYFLFTCDIRDLRIKRILARKTGLWADVRRFSPILIAASNRRIFRRLKSNSAPREGSREKEVFRYYRHHRNLAEKDFFLSFFLGRIYLVVMVVVVSVVIIVIVATMAVAIAAVVV